jgi:hypothetical protein
MSSVESPRAGSSQFSVDTPAPKAFDPLLGFRSCPPARLETGADFARLRVYLFSQYFAKIVSH